MLPHHLEHPWLLLLLIPLLALAWYLHRESSLTHSWAHAADVELITPLMTTPQRQRQKSFFILMFIWLLAILALAGPSFKPTNIPLYQNQQATILVASLNDSMLANDIPPSRLVRMRYKLLDSLKQSKDREMGLIAFSGEPYVVSPLTQDSNTIANLVDDLSPDLMPVAGNQLAQALLLAQKTLQQGGKTTGHIVILTADPADAAAVDTAKQLAKAGITTSVLGVATPMGAPILKQSQQPGSPAPVVMSRLDSQSLEALADAGQGQYRAFSNDNSDLNAVLNMGFHPFQAQSLTTRNRSVSCDSQTPTDSNNCMNQVTFWHNQGYWLVWLCLPLVLLAFRRGSPWLDID